MRGKAVLILMTAVIAMFWILATGAQSQNIPKAKVCGIANYDTISEKNWVTLFPPSRF